MKLSHIVAIALLGTHLLAQDISSKVLNFRT